MNSIKSETMKELAYGVIPLRKKGGVWSVLLVKHHSGDHWSFPKGHSIEGETPKETALRELHEETGLKVKRFLVDDEITEKYQFVRKGVAVSKTVTYYIAEVSGDIFLQFEELCGGKWVPLFEAELHVTYPESRNVCQRVFALFDRFH
jgi:bis(5'-nucleosidyl)-tetraphosphatase